MHFPTLNPTHARSILALAICLACSHAAAVEPSATTTGHEMQSSHRFAIARQPLANALDQLSVQSRLQIAYSSDMAQGIESPASAAR